MTNILPEFSQPPGNSPSSVPSSHENNRYIYASSKDVAAYFGKRHADVLRVIRNLKCSGEFYRLNFTPFKTNDLTGESTSHVDMTREGFTFLVMGFTGAKALQFKEAYIAAFNEMEERLRNVAKSAPLPNFSNPSEAARAWADEYDQKLVAQEDKADKTMGCNPLT